MKFHIGLIGLIIFSLASCSEQDNSSVQTGLPYIITDYGGVDTLNVNEKLTLRYYLSDTSFYNYITPHDNVIHRVQPVFSINDSIIYNSMNSDTLEYTHTANKSDQLNFSGNSLIRIGILFPHPTKQGNLIRIEKSLKYYLREDDEGN